MTSDYSIYVIESLTNTVWHALDQNLLETAKFTCDRLRSLAPNNQDVNHLVANVYYRDGQYQQACALTAKHPSHIGCLYIYALSCLKLKDFAKAITAIENALPHITNTPTVSIENASSATPNRLIKPTPAMIHAILGHLYKANDLDFKAIKSYAFALRLDPLLWEAANGLCQLCADLKISNIYRHLKITNIPAYYASNEKTSDENEKDSSTFAFKLNLDPFNSESSRPLSSSLTTKPKAKTFDIPSSSTSSKFAKPLFSKSTSKLADSVSHFSTPTSSGTGPSTGSFVTPPESGKNPAGISNLPHAPVKKIVRPSITTTGSGIISRNNTASTPSITNNSSTEFVPRRSSRLTADIVKKNLTGSSSNTTGSSSFSTSRFSFNSHSLSSNNKNTLKSSNMSPPISTTSASLKNPNGTTNNPSSITSRTNKMNSFLGSEPASNNTTSSIYAPPLFQQQNQFLNKNPTNNQQKTIQFQQQEQKQAKLELETREEALEYIANMYILFTKILLHFYKYECDQAIETISNLPSQHQSSSWVVSKLARIYFEKVEYVKSLSHFRNLRELEPFRYEDMEYFSTLLWHLRMDYELSYLAYDLSNFARDKPQTWCVVGNACSLQSETDAALRCFKRASQLDPYMPYPFTLQGHEHVNNDSYEQAQDAYRMAIKADKRHYNAWYGLGMVFLRLGNGDMADYHFRRALDINPVNVVLICCIAMVLERNGKNQEALAQYTNAIRMKSSSAMARYRRARLLIKMGKIEEALHEFLELEKYANNEPCVYYFLGQVYKLLGKRELAVKAYTYALNLDPKGSQMIKEALENLQYEIGAHKAKAQQQQQQKEAAALASRHHHNHHQSRHNKNFTSNGSSSSFNPDMNGSHSRQEVIEAEEVGEEEDEQSHVNARTEEARREHRMHLNRTRRTREDEQF